MWHRFYALASLSKFLPRSQFGRAANETNSKSGTNWGAGRIANGVKFLFQGSPCNLYQKKETSVRADRSPVIHSNTILYISKCSFASCPTEGLNHNGAECTCFSGPQEYSARHEWSYVLDCIRMVWARLDDRAANSVISQSTVS